MQKTYTLDQINDLIASGKLKSMTLEAVVTRADGTVERQGTIAGFHKNPIKHLLLWMRIKYDRIRVQMGKT